MTETTTLDALAALFGPADSLPAVAAIAVSGGGDSVALLRAAHMAFKAAGKTAIALTVDHGLRDASATEAATVAGWCAPLGIEHHILRWQFDGTGNLSAAARDGRYRAMADFCQGREISHLYTGHTRDDQAETVLMRLARGSGIDGLAGMAEQVPLWGITVLRPFLNTTTRDQLRAALHDIGQGWIDDPTNDDAGYDRVKARRMLDTLAPLGLTRDRLVQTAAAMARGKDVLDAAAAALITNAAHLSPLGFAKLEVAAFQTATADTRTRAFARLLCLVSGAHYRPDYEALCAALGRVTGQADPAATTLHGCVLRRSGAFVTIMREPAACDRATRGGLSGSAWDGRFDLDSGGQARDPSLSLRMIGEAGLRQIPKDSETVSEAWRQAPREARMTTPGLWHGETLVSAPLAPWSAAPDPPLITARIIWPEPC